MFWYPYYDKDISYVDMWSRIHILGLVNPTSSSLDSHFASSRGLKKSLSLIFPICSLLYFSEPDSIRVIKEYDVFRFHTYFLISVFFCNQPPVAQTNFITLVRVDIRKSIWP